MLLRADLAFFPLCKEGNDMACYVKTNCFHFVKIDYNDNKSEIDVKSSTLETVSVTFLLHMFAQTVFFSIILELWITLINLCKFYGAGKQRREWAPTHCGRLAYTLVSVCHSKGTPVGFTCLTSEVPVSNLDSEFNDQGQLFSPFLQMA
jgi:hypothetical protein